MKPSRVGSPAAWWRIRNDSLENGHSHTGGHIFVYTGASTAGKAQKDRKSAVRSLGGGAISQLNFR